MQGADYDGQQTPRGSAYKRPRRSIYGPAGRLLGEVADRGQRPAIGIVSAYALRRAGSTGTHKATERPRRTSDTPPTRNANPRRTSDTPRGRLRGPETWREGCKRSAARTPGRMPRPEADCVAPPNQ